MSEQVVTELVIDADTSGAARYEQAMNGAAQASTNVLQSIVAAGIGIGAALGSLRLFVDQIGGLNKQFTDSYEAARSATMSVREFQETLYAGRSKGLTEKDFISGLDKIGADLIQASRGSTEFGRLFAANGVSIRNVNGELKTTKEALGDIANLMKNAGDPQIEQAVAKIVGLSKEWIPFLRDGADEIERTKKRAAALGIIIGDDVIAKSREFDKEWKVATAAWDLQFKASLASIMPLLIQAAGLAKTILDAAGKAASVLQTSFTPVEEQSVKDIESRISKVEELKGKMKDLAEAQAAYEWATTEASDQFTARQKSELKIQNAKNEFLLSSSKSMLLGDNQADLKAADETLEKLKQLVFWKKQLVNLPEITDVNEASFGNKQTKLPGLKEESKDQFERATDQLEKHTARVEADSRAQGLGAAALAEFRAEAVLTAAALQAGLDPASAKVANKIQDLAQDAGDAALALEKAKVAANIDFANKTRFLTPEDLSIAQQLKGIYGNDVPAALDSSQAAQIRFNNRISEARGLAQGFARDLISGLTSGKSLMDSLGSAATQLSGKLTDKALTSLFSGDLIGAATAGVGAVITGWFGGQSEKKKKEEEARKAAAEAEARAVQAAAERTEQYNDRAKMALIDTTTLQGQLAAFDIQANQDRRNEAQNGNRAIVALEKTLAVERQAIVDKANAAIVKSMNDFLASIKTGANSILSPEDQLKYQQDLFASQFEKAKGGDQESLEKITGTAQALLDLAKTFFASSEGYTAIYKQVTDSISALAANAAPLSGMAMGGLVGQYAGGMVGNGRYNVDSVLARYAGGGNIALAGGEYVTRASSVNAGTKRALDYVNRTGSLPPANNGGSDNREVVRVLTDGFNGQTEQIVDAINGLSDRMKRMEDVNRQTANLRRVPGTKAA